MSTKPGPKKEEEDTSVTVYHFGLWSKVFLDYAGLWKALRAVIQMRAGQVGA
jgi:hypothetical protein